MLRNLIVGLMVGTAFIALHSSGSMAQSSSSQSGSNSAAGANSGSSSGASVVLNQGAPSNQTLDQRGGTSNYNNNSGDVTVRTTPTVYAPPVSGGNPCTLAVSGGVSVIGWGAAAGGTFVDEECATRQKIAMVHNAGYHAAGRELMCNDKATYNAFKATGTPCVFRAAFEPAQATPPRPSTQPVPPPVVAPAPMVMAKTYPRCSRSITDNCVGN